MNVTTNGEILDFETRKPLKILFYKRMRELTQRYLPFCFKITTREDSFDFGMAKLSNGWITSESERKFKLNYPPLCLKGKCNYYLPKQRFHGAFVRLGNKTRYLNPQPSPIGSLHKSKCVISFQSLWESYSIPRRCRLSFLGIFLPNSLHCSAWKNTTEVFLNDVLRVKVILVSFCFLK